ncbi:MAG: LysR family transcriptional regulator [Hyphomicrobiales bacterium]|nr:LysR family transcriptional regulator [Hyphomicrobiales bacterium]
MRYTLKQLRYLEAAARLHSITAAAKEFNISPSSIAAAIDGIEAELSQPLFNRHPSKGVAPTRFGGEFLKYVRELLQSHSRFEQALSGISENIEGSINMGCFTPIAPIVLPLILKIVSDAHPNLSIQIIEGDAENMVELLRTNKIDLALTYSLGVPESFHFESLFHAPPHVTLSASHPLASRHNLTLEELADEPLILLNLDRTRAYMLDLFEQRGLKPNILFFSRSSEMVRSLVAAEFGYSIFNVKPRTKQTYTMGDLVRIPLSSHHLAPEFGIIHHGMKRLTSVSQAVIEACSRLKSEGVFQEFVVSPIDT